MFFGSAEIAALAALCAEVTGLECRNEGRFLLPVGALYAPVFYCRDYGLIRKGGHGRDVSIFLRICTGYCILVSTSIAGHTSRVGCDQRAEKGDSTHSTSGLSRESRSDRRCTRIRWSRCWEVRIQVQKYQTHGGEVWQT